MLASAAASNISAAVSADSLTVAAKAPAETNDSIFHQLSEVVVEGRTQRVIKHGVEYIPDKRTKRAATDATQLLLFMQIPQLSVTAGSSDIKTVTGRGVATFIDYRPASEQELAGLLTKDVLRVEVLEYPQDPRFEGAAYVVNFIMQKYEWGGYTKANVHGTALSYDGINGNIYSKFAYRKWIFDANVSAGMSHNNNYREHTRQTYRDVMFQGKHYDELDRIVNTDSYLNLSNSQYASLRATLNLDNVYIQHSASFYREGQPRLRSVSTLSMPQAGLDDSSSRSDQRSQSINPIVRGYYYFTLPKNNTLSISWNFRHSHTRRNSLYTVAGLSPIVNTNSEDTYAPEGNISYSKKFNHNNTFRTALMSYNTIYDTKYGGSYDGRQKLLSSENMLFLEYMQNWEFGLSLYSRVGMSYVIGRVNGVNTLEQWNPRLGAQLQYQINDKHYASIEGWWGNGHPGASEYNDALVQSNELLWLQGNPDMKNTLFQQVTAGYTFMPNNKVSLSAYLEYEGNPDKQAWEYTTLPGYDGLVRRTVNSGDYRAYRARISGTVRLFNNSLALQAQGKIERAVYTGIDSDRQTWCDGWIQAVYYLKNFSFIANYIAPSRVLNGYSMGQFIKVRSGYGIQVGYNVGDFNITAAYRNWFSSGDIHMRSSNPRLAVSSTEWYSDCAPTLKLGVTYTFSYGKKIRRGDELNSSGRIDSAILK